MFLDKCSHFEAGQSKLRTVLHAISVAGFLFKKSYLSCLEKTSHTGTLSGTCVDKSEVDGHLPDFCHQWTANGVCKKY